MFLITRLLKSCMILLLVKEESAVELTQGNFLAENIKKNVKELNSFITVSSGGFGSGCSSGVPRALMLFLSHERNSAGGWNNISTKEF